MASEQFSICWDSFHKNMCVGMTSLLHTEDLVDVTLAVEGKFLKAHKMVLSICSPYFREMFRSTPCQHPIVFMKDFSYVAIRNLLDFMYQGEVEVSQENLAAFINTAKALQIKGLADDVNGTSDDSEHLYTPKKVHSSPTPEATPLSVKRPKLSVSPVDSQLRPLPVTKTYARTKPGTQPVTYSVADRSKSLVKVDVEPPDPTPDDGNESFDDNTENHSITEGEESQAATGTEDTSVRPAPKRRRFIHKTIDTKSRKICCVLQCQTYCTKDVSLHNFPTDPILVNIWKSILKIGKPITKYMVVCSQHFSKYDYVPGPNRTRRRLKKNAVPSLKIPPY